MSTKRIILISGYARSGKDSLAQALERELAHLEPVRVKFANELKTALGYSLVAKLGLTDVDVFTEDNAAKQAIRPLLVEFGKYARSIDKDVFVKAAWDTICDLFENGKGVAIVPDLRYANEINLISEWAKKNGWDVTHLSIRRYGNEAANNEELLSINCLPQANAQRMFMDGDLNGIERWAKELCSKPATPVPMPTIPVGGMNLGGPIDPAKVAAYSQPNAGTKLWMDRDPNTDTFPSYRPGVDLEALVKRVETLEEDGNIVDGIIDRVSQRTDTNRDNIDHLIRRVEDLEAKADLIMGLRLTLERMEARLRRLEIKP